MSVVVASKPDFVDAVVECNNSLFQNRFANIGDQALRVNRKTIVVGTLRNVLLNMLGYFFKPAEIPMRLLLKFLMDAGNARRDVSDDFDLGKVNGIHGGTEEVDMNNVDAASFHKEGGLFHNIVTDIDDQICGFDRTMNEVAGRERRVAKEARITLIDDALSHLRGDVVDVEFFDEISQGVTGDFSIRTGPHDQKRVLGRLQHFDRRIDGLGFGGWPANVTRRDGWLFGLFVGDIFG